jgi:UDP-N-acetylglucosamine--N-acetylmuramyl-(pentapeptide) pyrophosphoryl-undecaprenol N-acetylglucosamine transferase
LTRPYAVIAGGGTGGHVVPALAVARALVARGHEPGDIRFVGSRRGLEARLVPEAGFPITLLPGRGVSRRLSWQSVAAVGALAGAAAQAFVMLARWRPAVVASVGGYASAPAVLAAILLRRPLVVAEQNAVPGLANRLAARFARVSAVAFAGTALPRAVVTGNPVRPEILAIDRSVEGRRKARAAFGLPEDRMVVAAFGGSLGSRRINGALAGLVASWASRADLAVRHVIGARDWDEFANRLGVGGGAGEGGGAAGLLYQPVRYEERMDLLLTAADVAVCRAGGSVAELAVAGLPSILVPLPGAPGDHQTANARAFADAGAAVLVPDHELTSARLAAELDALLEAPQRLRAMGEAAKDLAHPDAADQVAALIEESAGRG